MFLFCLVFAMSLCASVYMCFVVTCWERADLLALVCGVYCEFVTFPLVSWVRCGNWLYRFLIFAPLLTLEHPGNRWSERLLSVQRAVSSSSKFYLFVCLPACLSVRRAVSSSGKIYLSVCLSVCLLLKTWQTYPVPWIVRIWYPL